MMVWSAVRDALIKRDVCIMVSVLDTAGSTPREAGARMIVHDDASFSGTIGGGALEYKAIQHAVSLLRNPNPKNYERSQRETSLTSRSFALGPDLGQCCGGRTRLLFEIVTRERLAEAERFAELENGRFATFARINECGRLGPREEVTPLPAVPVQFDGEQLVEIFGAPKYHLVLFGAGHVGRALMLVLAPLPFDVTWVDSRETAFPAHAPSNFKCLQVDNPATVLTSTPDDAFILVMTHSHAMDYLIAFTALKENRFEYIGVIGSQTKRTRMKTHLKTMGLPEARLSSLNCPIGLSDIKSKYPASIAISVASELLIKAEALEARRKNSSGTA